jgi:hypothetical protein
VVDDEGQSAGYDRIAHLVGVTVGERDGFLTEHMPPRRQRLQAQRSVGMRWCRNDDGSHLVVAQ